MEREAQQKDELLEAASSNEATDQKQHDASEAEKRYAGMTRRTFALGVGGAAALLGLGSIRFLGTQSLVRPPGGQDENLLLAQCIRCGRCGEVCPKQIIVPSHIESGILNARTPTLDFHNNYCTWCEEENDGVPLCVQSCPTTALSLAEGATREETILGIAVINTEECIAYRFAGCRFCYDACPYDAIYMDEYNRPVMVEDRCNGCGACEAVCISLQATSIHNSNARRAIYVVTEEEKEQLA